MNKKRAFTLAEVLITLTIIGVIAALTIPNLMKKWEDQHSVVAAKEAYSILDNAIKQAIREEGNLDDWAWPAADVYDPQNLRYFMEKLKPFLKISKDCGDNTGCNSGNLRYKGLNGEVQTGQSDLEDGSTYGKVVLANGMSLGLNKAIEFYPRMGNHAGTKNHIGFIRVDINGPKGPNRWGYDVFLFAINTNGLYFNSKVRSGYSLCNKYATGTNSGQSCSYWVLKHGNMDYKYRDVRAEW